MAGRDFYPKYLARLEESDDLFQRFDFLSTKLESYLLERVLQCGAKAEIIARRFLDVFRNCGTVNYDAPGVAEAYAIIHFLDRFHRFQIFLSLLEQKFLPRPLGQPSFSRGIYYNNFNC
jgi:hypothetical protein